MTKQRKRGLMGAVLGRMAACECLIDDRHSQTMLAGLLAEADKVEDPSGAWEEVRVELCASWEIEDGPTEARKPFIYRDGVAVIPIHGILLNRFNWCWGFVTGYDFIRRQMNLAEADADVRLIVFDTDSPGGEAAGCDELARDIRALKTPTMAMVNTLAASGGFWLAAASGRVVCSPSGSVGSIGVYIQHMNIAKMFADWGIENEFVKAGEYKTSGNMFEPLSRKDREYLQGMVDERYDEFCSAVAEFRGIEETVVKGTQARVMRPTEALALGLIDAAESPTTAVASFVAELGNDAPPVEDSEEEVTMAEITSEDRATVANETKARIKGIMTHDEAKGREGLAEHLAYNTDMSVDDAVSLLKVSPKAEAEKPADEPAAEETAEEKAAREKKEADDKKAADDKAAEEAAKGKSQFEQAMDQGKHPEIEQGGGGGSAEDQERQAAVARILGAQTAATGRKFEKA